MDACRHEPSTTGRASPLMTLQWQEPQPVSIPAAVRRAVAGNGCYEELIAELLVRRGFTDGPAARAFLDPQDYTPAPPQAMPDLLQAVERLERALANRERIAVWGDFDVDGQTATTLWVQALRELGADVTSYIPSRQEMHGVNTSGVQQLIDGGIRLLLAADAGSQAYAAFDLAAAHGVDVLIADHHDLPEDLPNVVALVNPKRLPGGHPLYDLSGVGVAYEIVRACYERAGRAGSERFLDLVALGTVADVCPVRLDVRYLLQLGLAALRQTERLGLQALAAIAGLNLAYLTEEDVGFSLAPRLNAPARMSVDLEATSIVELLLTQDLTRARTLATALEALNARRKLVTHQILNAALAQLDQEPSLLDGPVIVVGHPTWDPGVVGIVAARLAARFARPAIVLAAPVGGPAQGSARSVAGIDIHAAITTQRHLLDRCGGHPMAAGLSLPSERIPELRHGLWQALSGSVPVSATQELTIDGYLPLDQVSLDLAEAVNRLAPFGAGNERPVFVARELELISSAAIGRTGEHRRTVVRDPQGCEQMVMWWQSGDLPRPQGRFDLAYQVSVSTYHGERDVQISWVASRALDPVVVEQTVQPSIQVQDYRDSTAPQALLNAMLALPGSKAVVWAEAVAPDRAPVADRTALTAEDTLIVWTIPPGPDEMQAALKAVSPQTVILFGIDPELDQPRAFLKRLLGMVRHITSHRDGETNLSVLAAHMAHRVQTVRLGLEWLAQKGEIEIVAERRDRVTLRLGSGEPGRWLEAIQTQLSSALAETAAYRTYFGRVDAGRLIEG